MSVTRVIESGVYARVVRDSDLPHEIVVESKVDGSWVRAGRFHEISNDYAWTEAGRLKQSIEDRKGSE